MYNKKAFTLPSHRNEHGQPKPFVDYQKHRTATLPDSYPRIASYGKLDDPNRIGRLDHSNSNDNKAFQYQEYPPEHNASKRKTMYTRPPPQQQQQTIENGILSSSSSNGRTLQDGVLGSNSNVGLDWHKYRTSQRSRHDERFHDIPGPSDRRQEPYALPSTSSRVEDSLHSMGAAYRENVELEYLGEPSYNSKNRAEQQKNARTSYLRNSESNNTMMSQGEEKTSRVMTSSLNNAHADDRLTSLSRQYSEPASSVHHHDLVSLHSIVSRKSVRKKQTLWTNKLFYTLAAIFLWTFIVLCIEDMDDTVGQNICLKKQEIRYWSSYVCLVIIATTVTVYFEKGTVFDSIILSLFNTVVLIVIHHIPLQCIKQDKISDKQMARIRGGLLLLTVVAMFTTWLFKRYTRGKKSRL